MAEKKTIDLVKQDMMEALNNAEDKDSNEQDETEEKKEEPVKKVEEPKKEEKKVEDPDVLATVGMSAADRYLYHQEQDKKNRDKDEAEA